MQHIAHPPTLAVINQEVSKYQIKLACDALETKTLLCSTQRHDRMTYRGVLEKPGRDFALMGLILMKPAE